ncbi:phage major capsid protein, HK97 family [Agrococcus jejuensis]|uniref:Phage major capsid protein, HK97 family n=2 Tax=Agrococcus jejuensis TaxID=399736 RepID=A0A1G8F083_9MICO|nr:phage major capsid protein, HK97 family [Agrococcus jejuensis]
MTTAAGNRAFLPEAIHQLIVEPVEQASIALQVSTVVNTGPADSYRVPLIKADPTAAWVGEGEEIPESEAEFGEDSSRFHKLAGLTIITRELAEDSSPAAASLVGQGLARDIAKKLDLAFFGTRVEDDIPNPEQPRGLEDIVGVNAIAAGNAWANSDPFVDAVYAAEAAGVSLTSFVANPADALILAKVKKAAGSNEPLLGNDPTQSTRRILSGIPLRVSPAVKPGTVWGIPTGRTIAAVRDDTKLDIDRSVYFTSDRVAIRATMRIGLLYPQPAAIQKITLG